jgi:hypothetical protein
LKIRVVNVFRPLLITLGWSTSTAALTLFMIFQGQFLPRNINGGGLYAEVVSPNPLWLWVFFLGNLAISVLAVMAISDVPTALISFFASLLGAAAITFMVLASPEFIGISPFPFGTLQEAATIFTFTAFFPVVPFVNLAGTVVGIALGERFL